MSTHATRMAAFDAVMYGVESDPILRATIVAMLVLDQAPDEQVLRSRVELMTRRVPKLRQVVSSTPTSVLTPRWETAPGFDLDYHLRRYRVAPQGGALDPVLRIAEQMSEQDFDHSRPLWELAVVDGLSDGRAAIVLKLHHAVTDGVGGMMMAASLFDLTREGGEPQGPDPDAPEARTLNPGRILFEGAEDWAVRGADSTRRYTEGVTSLVTRLFKDPAGSLASGAEFSMSAMRVLAPASEPMSPLMTKRSLSVHVAVLEAPLGDLKAAGKSVGGTLNDAFMAVVSGGLQRYHEAHDAPVADLRVNMPVNMRSDGDHSEGNHWVPARFLIPTDITDPRERMRELSPILRAARTEPALPISDFVMRRLVKLPGPVMTAVAGGLMKGTDVAATNVPGPPIPVYCAGAKVLCVVPFAPKSGAAVNVALMSYNGSVFLGLNIDTVAVREPEEMVACFAAALAEVLAVGAAVPASADKPVAKPAKKSGTKPAKKKSEKKSAKKG